MQKVVQYIERHKLFSLDDKILCGTERRADSVALLRLLLSLGYTCEAAHCNFHLRGAESDRDEHFVRQLCLEHRVTLHTVHFNTEQEAKERHISIRNGCKGNCATRGSKNKGEACSAAVIAVAHHQDDSVETLLLNLIRGTGINGLRVYAPKRTYSPPLALPGQKGNRRLSGKYRASLRDGQHQSAGRIYPQQNTLEPASP